MSSGPVSNIELSFNKHSMAPLWDLAHLNDKSREEARTLAINAAQTLGNQETFNLPQSFEGEESFDELIQANTQEVFGFFAPNMKWFEAASLEEWFLTRYSNKISNLKIAYPKIESDSASDGIMTFRICRYADLVPSLKFKGILEAPESAPIAQPKIIFVPCTLADLQGHRMGRGKGYYDRYLAQFSNTFNIGVIHNHFIMQSFPKSWVQPHDQDLEALLSQNKFFKSTTKETSK